MASREEQLERLLADALAGRDAAEAGKAAAEAALAALSLGAAPPAPSGGGDGAAALTTRATLTFPSRPLRSPAHEDAPCFLEDAFVGLIAAPVAQDPRDATLGPAFAGLLAAASGSARSMGKESCFYALATAHLPGFAESVGGPGGDVSAVALFTQAALSTAVWSFPSHCKPELHARSAAGSPGRPAHCPAFNGELKSAGDGRALEQAVYYTTMDMVRVFFPAQRAAFDKTGFAAIAATAEAAQHQRLYYTHPPTGYALVGYPYVGHLLALEWVGKVLVSPVSQPFFLGGPQHASAVAALPQPSYAAPEVLDLASVGLWLTAAGQPREKSAWSVHGGLFRKLVRGDSRSAQGFAAMHAAYAALAGALPRAPESLRLPRFARLLYGSHEVLVEMPAVAGRAATEAELAGASGALLPALAGTIVWLARARIVYTDLRAPNVLVDGAGAPWLVDFDDCLVAPAPVATLEGYRAAVLASPGGAQGGTFAASLGAGRQGALEAALHQAFEEAEARAAAARAAQAAGGGGGGSPAKD